MYLGEAQVAQMASLEELLRRTAVYQDSPQTLENSRNHVAAAEAAHTRVADEVQSRVAPQSVLRHHPETTPFGDAQMWVSFGFLLVFFWFSSVFFGFLLVFLGLKP